MSNKIHIFFLIVTLSLPTWVNGNPGPEVDSLLKVGNYLFEYERFPEAIRVYETLVEQGMYHEKMLYRLAYMHENLGQYPESIYYLRRVQWDVGGEYLEEKIAQLMRETSKERLSPGEGWNSYRLFLRHYYIYVAGIIGLLLFAGALLVLPRWRRQTAMLGTAITMAGLILVALMIEQQLFSRPKGVIMQPTRFYEMPAYAGVNRSLPIGPGATVNIDEENDIWYKISMGQFKSWVPKFVVRKVE